MGHNFGKNPWPNQQGLHRFNPEQHLPEDETSLSSKKTLKESESAVALGQL